MVPQHNQNSKPKSGLNYSFSLSNGYSLPVFGIGTYQLTGLDCEKVVATALNLGYRLFDGASRYNNSENIGRT
jgi:diketogulonate reductase-like aldo/keto reductase